MTAPVLQALTQAAVEATGATQGWLLQLRGADLVVVGAAGGEPGGLLGMTVTAGTGSAGFVMGAGQALAIAPRPEDPIAAEGVAGRLGRVPASMLSVPCGTDEEVLGALELVDKADGDRFSIDDVELATLLGAIAGAALAENGAAGAPPPPAELASALSRLAAADPTRYAAVAAMVAALVDRG